MGKLAALLALLALSGCATQTRTVRVEIPVAAECPAPPGIARPYLPSADLATENPGDVIRACVGTVEALQGYAMELEAIVNGYRRR